MVHSTAVVIAKRKTLTMSGTGWALTGVSYLVLVSTLCLLSFRKGHWVLGLIGLVAGRAILPARRLR
jgi:hypothetical protein